MKLIVGLGNPGKEYESTRHNTGFMAIDYYAKELGLEINKKKMGGLYTETLINNEKVILLKPQKFINLSGEVIKEYLNYFKIPVDNLLVICDDMDLDVGVFKLRYKGSSAGHNGLKNIEANLGTNEYKRIKIGISKNNDIPTVDYVLGKFSKSDMDQIKKIFITTNDIIPDFIELSFENLMNKYN